MSAVTVDHVTDRPFAGRRQRDAVVLAFPISRVRPALAGPAAPLRITRRGRLALTLLVSTVAAAVVGVLGTGQATAGDAVRDAAAVEVVVVPGDTLWGIASESASPGEDVRDVIAEIVELNGLPSSGVVAGQTLVVPAAD